jgi:hypothetical protein
MHRTTVMLPSELKNSAQHRAEEMGISLGELIRKLLENELRGTTQERRAADPLFTAGIFTGPAPTDLAENHDDYLYGDAD